MPQNIQITNSCISAPGLAIATTNTFVKFGNTFQFKANGRITATIATNNTTAVSLVSAPIIAPYPSGTAATAGLLATGFYRVYALIGTLSTSVTTNTGIAVAAPTFTWLASADYSNTADLVNSGNFPVPDNPNSCVIGWVIIMNQTGSNFTPGTTALTTAGLTVTYIDNYAQELV